MAHYDKDVLSPESAMSEPNPSLEEFLFEAALAKSSTVERDAFLDGVCRGNPTLRARLDLLLEGHFGGLAFLTTEPKKIEQKTAQPSVEDEAPSNFVGRYKLLEKIGEGGFGEVWMAEQREPVKRRVALKIIKLGMDTKQVVARFEAERQALALMEHPNIAKVFDGGATATGRPYFVMELVRGQRITEYCDQNQLPTQERLKLFMQVCHAVQHAHQKGVIHRDLKPSNILVTTQDGAPITKVIDFGIAKATQQELTDKTVFTQFRQFLGTPAYISPEQAEMSGGDVDTRSDVYSLGVLLYELLTGQTPFDSNQLLAVGLDELRRTIREVEPARPSTRLGAMRQHELTTTAQRRGATAPKLINLVRGDLDWIVMKCLEKDRARRYEAAIGLSRDIERHLENEPVTARPPSRFYEFQKTVRRHWVGFAAGLAILAALAIGLLVSTLEAVRANRADSFGQRVIYAARMNLAQAAWEQNQIGRMRELLEETTAHPQRGFEWYYWQRQLRLAVRTFRGHFNYVNAVAFSPDEQHLVTASEDRSAIVWDALTGSEIVRLKGHREGLVSVAFSADGRRIATGSRDQTAKVWDTATGKEIFSLEAQNGTVWSVAFSPDGQRIVTAFDGPTPLIWNAASGKRLFPLRGHEGPVYSARFSPDGTRIVTGSADGTARVWETSTGTELFTIKSHDARVISVAFSPNNQRIATGGDDGTAKLWDVPTGKEVLSLHGHLGGLNSVAFSPDSRRIATGSDDRTVKVWEVASGRELFTIKGHASVVNSVDFSASGQWILTSSDDHTAKLWDTVGNKEPLTLREQGGEQPGLVSVSAKNDEQLALAFSPEGGRIVTGGTDGTAKIWDAADGRLLRLLKGHTRPIRAVAFSYDGQQIVTGSGDATARLWDAATGGSLHSLNGHQSPVTSVAFAPDGRKVITGSADHTAKVWDATTGKYILTLSGHRSGIFAVAFSADGRWIASGSDDNTAMVWDAISGRRLNSLTGHNGWVDSVAFSSNGKWLLTASNDSTAKLWDWARTRTIRTFKAHAKGLTSAAFSPDGQRIVTASLDQTARVWDVVSGEELLTFRGHNDSVNAVAWSTDGQRIATASADQTTKVWSAATPHQVARWQKEEKEAAEQLSARADEQYASARREQELAAQDPCAVKQWLVLAPLAHPDKSGKVALSQEEIPNEAGLRPRVGQRIQIGETERVWRAVEAGDYLLEISQLLNANAPWSVAYAVCYLDSTTNQGGLLMKIGSDNQSKVYLNDKEIYRREEPRTYVPDQDVVTNVTLNGGLNTLVFKLASGNSLNRWRSSIRFTDAEGRSVKGVRATITPALSQDPGTISRWLVLAPIPFKGTNGFKALDQKQIPGEADLHPWAGTRTRAAGREQMWRQFNLEDYALDFKELVASTNADWCVAYAVCYIESQQRQTDLTIRVGSDDQSKVYLNGKEVYRCEQPRPFEPDQDEVRGIELKAGLNVLVFKVVNETRDWRGSIRFTDAAGQPVRDIQVLLTPPRS